MSRTLFGLRISPWTERARWALDHHKVTYAYHEHVPMLGELLLRRKARTNKASVPLLSDGDDVVMGSLAIAKHAEQRRGGTPLFPPSEEGAIDRWADVAERITKAGRDRLLSRMVADSKAQAESLPSFVPGGLRGVMAPTAGMAIRFLARKYGSEGDPEASEARAEETIRPLLEETREAIKDGGYVLAKDCFTFADIALASSLQVLRPRAEMAIGPATRAAWTNEKLADEFEDLVAWRDTVYAKHRSS
ncbi:MAG: glutathione S-transferase [Labilithrix sp.]|nr:glutathione S-transferase [Labilithrix sp.]MCW5812782.1 glutathione S-transferase [Labilithrix sp.]